MVAIVKNNEQLYKALNQKADTHIVLHKNNAQNIVENLKQSLCTNSSSSNTPKTPKTYQKSIFRLGRSQEYLPPNDQTTTSNPLYNKAKSNNENRYAKTGGNPQPKKRSMKRKKPKKKGAAARKTQMKIKQKKTRNKIKKQMRKTKRKR
jgi:hypothetical protein